VRRVTAGVAAAAVLGTVVFGGLAAAGSKDSASADDPAATTGGPTGDDGAQGDRGGDAMPGRFFDDGGAQTPSPSEQAPVAPSGAS
jgi:hypothetical protein